MSIMQEPYAARTNAQMKDVLMDPHAPGPDIHYHMIRGGPEKKNITVMEPGLVGEEFIKTYGHYHLVDFAETYEILHGKGIVLLQTREQDAQGEFVNDRIAAVKAIAVQAGDTITIPVLMGHALVNTGDTWLVTSDNSPFAQSHDSASMPAHADYEALKKMHGLAYYVVSRDGKPALVKNPAYAAVPEATIETMPHHHKWHV